MANKPVLKVAKSGESITSSDIRDFAFHSDYAMWKVHTVSDDTVTINAGSSTGYVDIAHTLGYVPAYLVYVKIAGSWQLFPTDCRTYATDSIFRITYNIDSPQGTLTYDVRVVVFKDKIE